MLIGPVLAGVVIAALGSGSGGEVTAAGTIGIAVAGIGMAVLCFGSLLSPTVRRLGHVPPYQAPDESEENAGASGATVEPARA